jgi:hypothetical protein
VFYFRWKKRETWSKEARLASEANARHALWGRVSLFLPRTKNIININFSSWTSLCSPPRAHGYTCITRVPTGMSNKQKKDCVGLVSCYRSSNMLYVIGYKLVGIKYSWRRRTIVSFCAGGCKLKGHTHIYHVSLLVHMRETPLDCASPI